MKNRDACLVAIDAGTTGITVLVVDRQGGVRARASRELPQHFPQPGWVEHDPDEIWRVTKRVLVDALSAASCDPSRVAGIGVANQRETAILWERVGGRPVAPAIVWQDRRTAALCDTLKAEGLEPAWSRRTGLLIDPYFSATKIAWLLDHHPGLRARAAAGEIAFGTVDSWLVWQLTGGARHVTDPSNASRTLLYDIHRLTWDDEILARLAIPAALLPEVVPSSGVCGVTAAEAFFGCRVPVAGIAGDQQAALFGQACRQPGLAKATYGTGCFILLNTGAQAAVSHARLLTTIAWRLGDAPPDYALEGAVFVAGAAIQWLRDGLGILAAAAESETLAASLPDNGDVYFVPALTGLGAPHWDPYARGAIVGLTRGAGRAHLVRAALESIAHQTCDVVDAMAGESGLTLRVLRADGGAAANGFLMQFQADLLGVPVEVPAVVETTALGAAYLAGLGVGFWRDQAEIDARWQAARRFTPSMSAATRAHLRARWRDALGRARGWAT